MTINRRTKTITNMLKMIKNKTKTITIMMIKPTIRIKTTTIKLMTTLKILIKIMIRMMATTKTTRTKTIIKIRIMRITNKTMITKTTINTHTTMMITTTEIIIKLVPTINTKSLYRQIMSLNNTWTLKKRLTIMWTHHKVIKIILMKMIITSTCNLRRINHIIKAKIIKATIKDSSRVITYKDRIRTLVMSKKKLIDRNLLVFMKVMMIIQYHQVKQISLWAATCWISISELG
jgi:hypothetical protein